MEIVLVNPKWEVILDVPSIQSAAELPEGDRPRDRDHPG